MVPRYDPFWKIHNTENPFVNTRARFRVASFSRRVVFRIGLFPALPASSCQARPLVSYQAPTIFPFVNFEEVAKRSGQLRSSCEGFWPVAKQLRSVLANGETIAKLSGQVAKRFGPPSCLAKLLY